MEDKEKIINGFKDFLEGITEIENNKKQLQEKLNNMPNDKIIYQRYNGIIKKYIVEGNIYIDVETGIATDITKYLIIGNLSENIIDLIEEGDYVNGYKVLDVMEDLNTAELHLEMESNCPTPNCNSQLYNKDIKSIATKEQMENIQYKLEE